jgi:hypothetical protein
MLTEIVSIINSGTVTDGWCYYVNQNNYNAFKNENGILKVDIAYQKITKFDSNIYNNFN